MHDWERQLKAVEELREPRGFMSDDDLHGSLKQSEAIAKGMRGTSKKPDVLVPELKPLAKGDE